MILIQMEHCIILDLLGIRLNGATQTFVRDKYDRLLRVWEQDALQILSVVNL